MTSDLRWWPMSLVTAISYYVWAYVCDVILWAVCAFLMNRKSCYLKKKTKFNQEKNFWCVPFGWGTQVVRRMKF